MAIRRNLIRVSDEFSELFNQFKIDLEAQFGFKPSDAETSKFIAKKILGRKEKTQREKQDEKWSEERLFRV